MPYPRLARQIGLLIVLLSIFLVVTRVEQPITTEAASQVYLGVSPDTSLGSILSQTAKFESDAGKQAAIVSFFYQGDIAWTASIGNQLRPITDRGSIPMIGWKAGPANSSASNPQCGSYTLASYAQGAHDTIIRSWAAGLKTYGDPVMMRWAWEMNGAFYCWGKGVNGNTPGDFINAWRRIHDIFRQEGASNVIWVWSPNFDGGGAYPIAPYFPGDAYIDWAGLDGYNWVGIYYSNSMSFERMYDTSYATVTSLTAKPIMIAEFASNEAGDGGSVKAQWITHTFANAIPAKPQIKAAVWYNAIDRTPDGTAYWPIDSSAQAKNAFAAAVASPTYLAKWATSSPPSTPSPGAGGALVNGSFDATGQSPWYQPWGFTGSRGIGRGTLVKDGGYSGASSARIDVTVADPGSPWNVQLYQTSLSLVGGRSVTVSFSAKASKSRAMGVAVNGASYHMPSVSLTTGWKQYSYTFTPPTTTTTAALTFNLAQDTGSVWLDAVTFTEGGATSTPTPTSPTATPTPSPSPVAGGTNQLANASFDSAGQSPWHSPWAFSGNGGSARSALTRESGVDGSFAARIAVTTGSSSPWHSQLWQGSLDLTAGKQVTVQFMAKASKSRVIAVGVQNQSTFATYYYNASVPLTTTWQTFTYKFTPTTSVSNAFLALNFAQTTGSVWVDKVSFVSAP